MATYVISDMHGCRKEFDQMLELIGFSGYDDMWIIGDICDRGPESIPLLQEIMANGNMHMISGNHDEWLAEYAQTLIDIKKNEAAVNPLDMNFATWLYFNGGMTTADQFMDLELPECYDIKLFLENRIYYKQLTVRGRKFLLVHAGLGKYAAPDVRLSTVPASELVWSHIGLDDNPFDDVTMIVGHTPTFLYGDEYEGKIAHGIRKDILHIDCGCVFGRALGCVRLDDMQEFYVPSSQPYFAVRRNS